MECIAGTKAQLKAVATETSEEGPGQTANPATLWAPRQGVR